MSVGNEMFCQSAVRFEEIFDVSLVCGVQGIPGAEKRGTGGTRSTPIQLGRKKKQIWGTRQFHLQNCNILLSHCNLLFGVVLFNRRHLM